MLKFMKNLSFSIVKINPAWYNELKVWHFFLNDTSIQQIIKNIIAEDLLW